jgi:hypothetical protein
MKYKNTFKDIWHILVFTIFLSPDTEVYFCDLMLG